MQPKSINECTDIELKSVAYDEIAKIDKAQEILKIINQELANRAQKKPVESPIEPYTPSGEEQTVETAIDTTEE